MIKIYLLTVKSSKGLIEAPKRASPINLDRNFEIFLF